jgi:DNA-binding transcriptional LysR family regulator
VNVELRHLRYFVAVAEELHFGRAAERLHMAQPPLSQAIRNLEAELGVELLARTSRRVELTEAGRALLEDARALLSDFDEVLSSARRVGRGETAHLTVGALSSTSMVVPPIARAFREREPHVGLTLKHMTVGELGDGLRRGDIDLAIAYGLDATQDGIPWENGFREQLLAMLPIVAAVPESHPLAGRESLSISELAGERWVHIPRNLSPEHHDTLLAFCRRHGFEPDVVAEGTTMRALLELVAGGVGVMIAPVQARHLQPSGVAYVPLPGEEARISMFWREGRTSPAARSFRELAAEVPSEELFGAAPVAAA